MVVCIVVACARGGWLLVCFWYGLSFSVRWMLIVLIFSFVLHVF